ncbi:MAG: Bd3614 family nucleic acid deaminase [Silvanigrellaceae bacterium]
MALAWLEWNGVVYWVEYQRRPFEPRSAVAALIEGIWQSFPASAHFMLRSRIFSTESPTQLCRGIVIVCAKRMTHVDIVPHELMSRMRLCDKAVNVNFDKFNHSSSLLNSVPQHSGVKAEQNRSIECWLLSREGRLLATAPNTAGRDRTRHAEMNLLKNWWQRERRPLPRGGRLWVTLEPCSMCAGAIWECVEDKADFKVLFLEQDFGSAAARSVLRGHDILEHCPNVGHQF